MLDRPTFVGLHYDVSSLLSCSFFFLPMSCSAKPCEKQKQKPDLVYDTAFICLYMRNKCKQEKIGSTSHHALLPMGYFVQEVMWGNSDEITMLSKCSQGTKMRCSHELSEFFYFMVGFLSLKVCSDEDVHIHIFVIHIIVLPHENYIFS